MVTGNTRSSSLSQYYRTANMMLPQLLYAKDPHSETVAVSVSLVPTFDKVLSNFYEVVENERPDRDELAMLSSGDDFHFTFIVDRSDSMSEENRMQLAIDLLELFVRSLPKGAVFSIISFGSGLEAFSY